MAKIKTIKAKPLSKPDRKEVMRQIAIRLPLNYLNAMQDIVSKRREKNEVYYLSDLVRECIYNFCFAEEKNKEKND